MSVDAERIYLSLPIPLQHVACSHIGWHTNRTRDGGASPRLLSRGEASWQVVCGRGQGGPEQPASAAGGGDSTRPSDPARSALRTDGGSSERPAVRVGTDDLALPDPGASCPCGRRSRLVTRVDERLEDYVNLPNGSRLGRMDHIFKNTVNIKEAQIRQISRSAITVRLVHGRAYTSEDEQQLLREMRKRVGAETEIAIEYADALPRTRTGKLRFVVSELPEASVGAPVDMRR